MTTVQNFCIHFRITLKCIRSQCHRQRTSLIVQLNLRPARRIELYTKSLYWRGYYVPASDPAAGGRQET